MDFLRIGSLIGILLLGLISPAFADLNDGLVAYYPFDGNANDESGNGNDGTVNGAVLTTDRFGNSNSAYDFDGVNDNITIPHSDSMNVIDGLSVSAWIVCHDCGQQLPLVGQHIVNKGAIETVQTYSLKLVNDEDDDYLGMALRGDWGPIHAWFSYPADELLTRNLNPTEWYHAVVLWDGSTMKVYKNGIHISAADRAFTSPVLNGDENLGIGSRYNSDDFFDGIVDEVRIYNRALSDTEILELFNYSPPQPPWGESVAQASSLYGKDSSDVSRIPNGLIFLLVPMGAIIAFRIIRRGGFTCG